MKRKISLVILAIFGLIVVSAGCGSQAEKTQKQQSSPAQKTTLPEMMTWTAYDVGSAGYVQASAMANALAKKFGTKVRILPSSTSIGRTTPLKAGTAGYSFLGIDIFCATEGEYEFARYDWGPQDLRVILSHPGVVSLVATADSGIKTPKDLKGKRFAYVPGMIVSDIEYAAACAFAGLKWPDDVQVIKFPSYAASMKALIEGKADVCISGPTTSVMYELEASPQGIYWIPFPSSDKEGWKRIHEQVVPWLFPAPEDRGAGLKKGQPVELFGYGYPELVCYADKSADEVYALLKAIDQTKELWVNADPLMIDWSLEKACKPPAGAPFHEGAIRYFKEKGLWTAEDEEWNKKFTERVNKLQGAWKTVVEEAAAKKIPEKDFADYWFKRKVELVGSRW